MPITQERFHSVLQAADKLELALELLAGECQNSQVDRESLGYRAAEMLSAAKDAQHLLALERVKLKANWARNRSSAKAQAKRRQRRGQVPSEEWQRQFAPAGPRLPASSSQPPAISSLQQQSHLTKLEELGPTLDSPQQFDEQQFARAMEELRQRRALPAEAKAEAEAPPTLAPRRDYMAEKAAELEAEREA